MGAEHPARHQHSALRAAPCKLKCIVIAPGRGTNAEIVAHVVGGHSQSLVGVLPGEQGLALGRLVRLRRRRRAVVEPVVVVVAVVVAAEEAIGLAAARPSTPSVHHLRPVVVGRGGLNGRLQAEGGTPTPAARGQRGSFPHLFLLLAVLDVEVLLLDGLRGRGEGARFGLGQHGGHGHVAQVLVLRLVVEGDLVEVLHALRQQTSDQLEEGGAVLRLFLPAQVHQLEQTLRAVLRRLHGAAVAHVLQHLVVRQTLRKRHILVGFYWLLWV